MSRPTSYVCYGQNAWPVHCYFKNPTYNAEFSKFGSVTTSLLNCDELSVRQVDRVTSWSSDELTGSPLQGQYNSHHKLLGNIHLCSERILHDSKLLTYLPPIHHVLLLR